MNYLLDTHAFLWFLEGNSNLSEKARIAITDTHNKIFVSIASIWEIGIKLSLGKLEIEVSLEYLKNEILKNQFEILPLDFEHIIELTKLENHHKDPFDRILLCQATVEKLTLISKDLSFKQYKKTRLLW